MKASIPDSREEKGVSAKKQMKYNVSLLEYAQALQQEGTKSYIMCMSMHIKFHNLLSRSPTAPIKKKATL